MSGQRPPPPTWTGRQLYPTHVDYGASTKSAGMRRKQCTPGPSAHERVRKSKRKKNKNDSSRPPETKQPKPQPGKAVNMVRARYDVNKMYGNILRKPYFVPAAHINRVDLKRQDFCGHTVYIPQPPVKDMDSGYKVDPSHKDAVQESSYRDDLAHQHVLRCLRLVTAEYPQAMFVISQLKYEDYLRHPVPSQAPPCSTSVFSPAPNPCQTSSPTSVTLPVAADLKDQDKRRGDSDILILSRDRGFLNIEIKAVGDLAQNQEDIAVLKKVIQAVKQLNKGREVLQHLTSDKRPGPTIRSALAMPYVSEKQLRNILHDNPQVRKALCQCLNIAQSQDPVTYCLLADSVPPKDTPWQFKDAMKGRLLQWWRHVMGERGDEPALSDDDYVDLVARFCGPATFPPPSRDDRRARCRTVSEAVCEIGDLYNRLILRERQLEILNKGGNLGFLCGPPGTGKTVLLVLKATQWLRQTKNVHVVSTWSGSLAASHHIASVLRRITDEPDRVHVHEFDLGEDGEEPAVKTLSGAATTGPLCVICDEPYSGSEFGDVCTRLKNNCTDLCLWAASVYHGYRPPCLEEETLAEPLRTPPAITREIARSDIMEQGLVRKYDTQAMATTLLTEDLPPFKIAHQGAGHSKKWAGECELCGELLGDLLQKLCAGSFVSCSPPEVMTSTEHPQPVTNTEEHQPLSYRDVFILTTYYDLEDGTESQGEDKSKDAGDGSMGDKGDSEMDEDGATTSGLLKGLRKKNVPYRVVAKGDSPALQEVAVMAGPDAVVVADADTIRGLERNVVVWVPYDRHDMNEISGEEDFGRLDAMSRVRAQLVLITD